MKKHYEALDGLRGIAAAAVVWLHISDICHLPGRPLTAHLAVDFFFVLSGFVIAYAYEARLRSTMSFWRFLKERLIRLMPLAAFGSLLGGAVLLVRALTVHDIAVPNVVAATLVNAMLLPSGPLVPIHPSAFGADGPIWSLFWEMAINIAFALLALRLTTPRLMALVAAAAVLTVWTAVRNHGLEVGFSTSDFGFGFCRVLFPFSCGLLLQRLPRSANRLAPVIAVVLAGLLLGPSLGMAGEALAVLIVFPAVVWFCAGSEVGPKVGAVCVWLGRISYPVYVLNHPIVRLVANVSHRLRLSGALAAAAAMTLVLAASYAALIIDEPLRVWLRARILRAGDRRSAEPQRHAA